MSQSPHHTNPLVLILFASLFTVKDGLIFIEAYPVSGDGVSAQKNDPSDFVFADVNGDDWFYFEDTTTGSDLSSSHLQGSCAKPAASSHFNVRTISGSDTTLINFQYESTPSHKVLHEGRCSFAGLKPVSQSRQSESDSSGSRFRSQQL